MLGELGQLTPEAGEKEFIKSINALRTAVNSLGSATYTDKQKDAVTAKVHSLLASAATYLSDKRREVAIANVLKLRKGWENLAKKKASGLAIRQWFAVSLTGIHAIAVTPIAKLPPVDAAMKPQIKAIIAKADKVKTKVAAKSLTPEEAKKARNRMMLLGGGAIAAVLGALFLRRK